MPRPAGSGCPVWTMMRKLHRENVPFSGKSLASMANNLLAVGADFESCPRIDAARVATTLDLTPSKGRVSVLLAEGLKVTAYGGRLRRYRLHDVDPIRICRHYRVCSVTGIARRAAFEFWLATRARRREAATGCADENRQHLTQHVQSGQAIRFPGQRDTESAG